MQVSIFSKLLAVLLALAMIFAMSACQMPETGDSTGTDNDSTGGANNSAEGSDTTGETDTGEADTGTNDDAHITNEEQAAALINGFLTGAGESMPQISKEDLKDMIPAYADLMEKLALEQKKDDYFSAIKSAIDSIEGEIGQIRMDVQIDEETFNTGNREILYAGIKNGQIYLHTSDLDTDEEIDFYLCYDNENIYAVICDTDEEGLALPNGMQFPYNSMYDTVAEMLPTMEEDYNMMVTQLELAIDELFATLEEAGNELEGLIDLPELTAASFEKVEGKANTFRLTDAYLLELLMSIPSDGDAPTKADFEKLLSVMDVYPYITLAGAEELAGVGLYADIDLPGIDSLSAQENADYTPQFAADDTLMMDMYMGTDGMLFQVNMDIDALGHIKIDFVTADEGTVYDIDVNIKDILTLKSDSLAADGEYTATTTLTVPNVLTVTEKTEGTATYDKDTGALSAATLKVTVAVDCADISALGSVGNTKEDVMQPSTSVQPYASETQAIPFNCEMTMEMSFNPANILAENADILTYSYDVNVVAGPKNDTVTVDMAAAFSVKSEETGAYRIAMDVDMTATPDQTVKMDVSFRVALGTAKDFPTQLPAEVTDFLNEMKEDPTLNNLLDMLGQPEYTCEICETPLTEATIWSIDDDLGDSHVVCKDCYDLYFCTEEAECALCGEIVNEGDESYYEDEEGYLYLICPECASLLK